MRRRALARSGAVHVPAGDGLLVYGHVGRVLGTAAGTTLHAGTAADGPPKSAAMRARSAARLTARRTRTSSNGGSRTLRNMKSVPSRGATATRPGWRVM